MTEPTDLELYSCEVAGRSVVFVILEPRRTFRPAEVVPTPETERAFRVSGFRVGVVDQLAIPEPLTFRTFAELCRGRTFDLAGPRPPGGSLMVTLTLVNITEDAQHFNAKLRGSWA